MNIFLQRYIIFERIKRILARILIICVFLLVLLLKKLGKIFLISLHAYIKTAIKPVIIGISKDDKPT